METPSEGLCNDERNIEVKVRIANDAEFERLLRVARKLTESEGEDILQRDVFFKVQKGRLKLRYLQLPARSQLIYYERSNIAGPKLSTYNKVDVDEPQILETMLTRSNGIEGVVAKKRLLFMYDRTRIHLDKVHKLGNFLEFEVCLQSNEDIKHGQDVANKLMTTFGICPNDLMTTSYLDELKDIFSWKA